MSIGDPVTVLTTDELREFVEGATGRRVVDLRRLPGGGRRQGWDIRLAGDGVDGRCFLRYDPNRLKPWDPYSLRREADVYRALAPTTVPVARVLAIHPTAQAVLLSHEPGVPQFTAIGDAEIQAALQDQLVDVLVDLHAIDPRSLDLGLLGDVIGIRGHLERELDIWEGLYERGAEPDPLLTAALRWLRDVAPTDEGMPSLTQGDTGPGNFLHLDGRITAVVDWEFAHLGDPAEDLAWVSTRSVQEPLPDFAGLVQAYRERSGRHVDAGRIRYYRVFVELRIAILGARRHGDRPGGGEVGNGLAFGNLHRKLLVEALASAMELEVPPLDEPVPPPDEDDWLYREALDQLREVILPAVEDPFARLRTKGLARLVKHFRATAQWRETIRARTGADLAELLGSPQIDTGELRRELDRRLRRGEIAISDALPVLARDVQREVARAADVMGVLARRTFDRIDNGE
jgi:aminoglycoside phosphotransferase (APT) family kinase protein